MKWLQGSTCTEELHTKNKKNGVWLVNEMHANDHYENKADNDDDYLNDNYDTNNNDDDDNDENDDDDNDENDDDDNDENDDDDDNNDISFSL